MANTAQHSHNNRARSYYGSENWFNVHAYNPSIQEAEAGRLRVQSQPRLKNKNKQKTNKTKTKTNKKSKTNHQNKNPELQLLELRVPFVCSLGPSRLEGWVDNL
jgi:hypothetical protein